ncbi:hypothetical protein [Phormidesmis priestleyi]
MRIEQSEVLIVTPNEQMLAIPVTLTQPDRRPAVLLLIETFGLTSHIRDGGLTFFTACKLSDEIAAVASFYGMVLDEWIEAV